MFSHYKNNIFFKTLVGCMIMAIILPQVSAIGWISFFDFSIISLDNNQQQGGGPAGRVDNLRDIDISGSGQYAVFSSENDLDGSNLGAGIFVRDITNNTTTRINSPDSTQTTISRNEDYSADISSDGRYVTWCTNNALVTGDNNSAMDVYQRDLGTNDLTLVSVDDNGVVSPNGASYCLKEGMSVSNNGRYVLFSSFDQLDTDTDRDNPSSILQVYLRDLTTNDTILISKNTLTNEIANDYSRAFGGISNDGNIVYFQSNASNLIPNTTNYESIYMLDRGNNNTMTLVSKNDNGEQGDKRSYLGSSSANGRYFVYRGESNNIDPACQGVNIRLYDKDTDITQCISKDASGNEGNGSSSSPAISADGSKVVFSSMSSNLVDNDTNNEGDIFEYDIATQNIRLIGTIGPDNGNNSYPAISDDGQTIAFASRATNLDQSRIDSNDTTEDVFVTNTSERYLDVEFEEPLSYSSIEGDQIQGVVVFDGIDTKNFGNTQVTVGMYSGNAIEGIDYEIVASGIVDIPAGDYRNNKYGKAEFTLNLIDNNIYQANPRNLILRIIDYGTGIRLSQRDINNDSTINTGMTITITDNDPAPSPIASITSPANNTHLTGSISGLMVSWSGLLENGPTIYSLSSDIQGFLGTGNADGSGNWSGSYFLMTGTHLITLVGDDGFGHTMTGDSVTIIINSPSSTGTSNNTGSDNIEINNNHTENKTYPGQGNPPSSKDYCPNGDISPSYYDKQCDNLVHQSAPQNIVTEDDNAFISSCVYPNGDKEEYTTDFIDKYTKYKAGIDSLLSKCLIRGLGSTGGKYGTYKALKHAEVYVIVGKLIDPSYHNKNRNKKRRSTYKKVGKKHGLRNNISTDNDMEKVNKGEFAEILNNILDHYDIENERIQDIINTYKDSTGTLTRGIFANHMKVVIDELTKAKVLSY